MGLATHIQAHTRLAVSLTIVHYAHHGLLMFHATGRLSHLKLSFAWESAKERFGGLPILQMVATVLNVFARDRRLTNSECDEFRSDK